MLIDLVGILVLGSIGAFVVVAALGHLFLLQAIIRANWPRLS